MIKRQFQPFLPLIIYVSKTDQVTCDFTRRIIPPVFARLAQIAGALGQPLASLIPEATDDTSLRGRVLKLVDNCQPDKLEELYTWLSESNNEPDPRSIALVGVRGAGKSTIGKLLASRLEIPFIEFDAMIEKAAGISLVELFAIHGESYYRKLEKEVLSKFLAHSPRTVVATGGSLVTDRETWGNYCYLSFWNNFFGID